MMKDLIRKVLREMVTKTEVICDKCGWSWDIADGGDDLYICHECGHDNEPVEKGEHKESELTERYFFELPQVYRAGYGIGVLSKSL